MKKKQAISQKTEECIRVWRDTGEDTDILGSYTGFYKGAGAMGAPLYTPYDPLLMSSDTRPIQDADDL